MIFTPLGECAVGHTEAYNVYGVVIDSTAPYYKCKPTVCVRLIDPTLNMECAQSNGDRAQTFATLQLFANERGKLPHVLHVGDIMRFNKVNVSLYRDMKQFVCNVWSKSSWTIFRGYR